MCIRDSLWYVGQPLVDQRADYRTARWAGHALPGDRRAAVSDQAVSYTHLDVYKRQSI